MTNNLFNFSVLTAEEALVNFNSSSSGLTETQVKEAVQRYGSNLIASNEVDWPRVLWRQFKSPFLYLLVAAAALAWLLGEKFDAVIIIGFVGINVLIGFCQEYHSERSVVLLKKMVSSKVLVRREGREFLIDSREVVPGDLVIAKTGDRLQADLRWLEAENLQIDESVLTGEAAAAVKDIKPLEKIATDFFQAVNLGFSGTMVLSGRGVGVVIATGVNTGLGKITKLTGENETPGTFEKGLAQFSAFILRVILLTLAMVFLANLLIKGFNVNIPELLIFSVALAVSVIPEALPVVTTLTLSRGAIRLAKRQVVTKRLSAIEDLGSVDILCTDKTGTVTENRMEVADFFTTNKKKCLWYAALAAPPLDPRAATLRVNFDGAILNFLSDDEREKVCQVRREHEKPFDPVKRWNSLVIVEDKVKTLIVRGAPENVLSLCDDSEIEKRKIFDWSNEEGKKGHRVLALALREAATDPEAGDLNFLGLISFDDPIKPSARAAIEKSEKLGLRVKILTGDSLEVAGAVGFEIGLVKNPSEVITGEAWSRLSEAERLRVAEENDIFARVTPEHKFLIIQTLQKKFAVGFLGEGINDAPALKIADVGLVVDGAADIAREAADLVLLDHGLEVIVSGIKEGREIFANTVKYLKSTLTSNFGNFLAVAAATLLVNYLPMLPVQLLLLNLLSDFPMIAVATDSVDDEELKLPRHYSVKEVAVVALFLGIISTVFDFIFFAMFSRISPEVLHTNWFIASVLTELALTMSIRTKKPFFRARAPSRILSSLTIIGAALAIGLPFTSFGQNFFGFVAPQPIWLLTIVSLVLLYFAITEVVKYFYYKFEIGNGIEKRKLTVN